MGPLCARLYRRLQRGAMRDLGAVRAFFDWVDGRPAVIARLDPKSGLPDFGTIK